MKTQEKVLVIGNGFDLYHFLPTRYIDFMKTVNRLLELESNGKLSSCKYIKYLWGPDSPIYQKDEYIQKCYEIHTQKMHSVVLNQERIQELVNISKNNIWIKYFQLCLERDIGWIGFEKEIGIVLNAVQNLFMLDEQTNDLVNGVFYEQLTAIDLRTIDILEHLPFAEDAGIAFVLKEEYCKKGIGDGYYISINRELILEELEENLENLAKALCIYLREFVQKIALDKCADNPVFYNIDKVLNFNYTDTYVKLYDEDVEIKYIHGCINNEDKGIVLGINNDSKDELEEMDASLIRFKKYYQRAMKDTFYSVEDYLDDEEVQYQVSIVGHSIEITDKDILVGLLNHPRAKVTIYYHDEKAHSQQIVNLISLVGKAKFDELRNQKKVKFCQLKEFKEITSEFRMEEMMDETYEYVIKREYRFLNDSYGIENTLLIGNEVILVSVSEDKVGITEVKLVDHLLDLQEYYNHSGLYKGIVKLVSLFNDNRNCGAEAVVEYIEADEEVDDIISEIKALFETECEGTGICISEVKVVGAYIMK